MASKDQDQDESQEGGKGKKQKPGAVREVYNEMSIGGSLRSIRSNSKQGTETIALGVRSMAAATRRSLEPGRNETFSQAMQRLGVAESQLMIIHNQIVLQCYLTLLVAIFAVGSAALFASRGHIMAPLIAGTIFLTCLVKAAQSSIQCMSIRRRRLGMNETWLNTPGEWLPKRLHAETQMDKDDPLRDPALVMQLAKSARKFFVIGGSLIALSMAWVFAFPGNQWSLLYLGTGLVVIFFGAKNSFEVFKRRRGIHCDLFPWLTDPASWFPDLKAEKASGYARRSKQVSHAEQVGFGTDAGSNTNEFNKD